MSRHGQRVRPSRRVKPAGAALSREEERLRPLYSRVLGLRHVDPGGLLCFVFFEGSIILALLLTLAELVSWWAVLVLPVSVAVMVKLNDEVAAAVARSAARVPQRERERFRREMAPIVGRATVPREPGPPRRSAGPINEVTDLRALGDPQAGTNSGSPFRTGALRVATGGFRALPGGPARTPGGPAGPGRMPAGPDGTEPGAADRGPSPTGTRTVEGPASMGGFEVGAARRRGRGEPTPWAVRRPTAARPTNEHPVEPLGPRPAAQWPTGLDKADSPQQRSRQAARRRYE